MRRLPSLYSLLAVVLAASSCRGDDPAPAPPKESAPPRVQALPPGHPVTTPPADAVPPVPSGAGTGASGLTWVAPEGWRSEPPASGMRRAQYRVSGPAGDAECVVFYFGPGQGGDAAANAQRWASQFRQPDGRDPASALKTSTLQVDGMAVTLVEVKGTYAGGMGGGPTGDKPGYELLGAIAAGPDANWFFKLTGPEKTVEAQRASFEAMVRSLRKGP